MRDQIFEYIKNKGNVSFAELERDIQGFDGGGNEISIAPNVVLWRGLSDSASEAMMGLVNGGSIQAKACRALYYVVDGKLLRLPLAKRVPKNGFKSPRWLPVVWNVSDSEGLL